MWYIVGILVGGIKSHGGLIEDVILRVGCFDRCILGERERGIWSVQGHNERISRRARFYGDELVIPLSLSELDYTFVVYDFSNRTARAGISKDCCM